MAPEKRVAYYLAADVRELDRLAIEEHGIPGFTLMQRAGQAAFTSLREKWPGAESVFCFCGSGNNGGDGYVIAALAAAAGLQPTVIAVGDPGNLDGDARLAWQMAVDRDVKILPFAEFSPAGLGAGSGEAVVVDAMLGTGLSGAVRGPYLEAIRAINGSGLPVLAVDIPSGLCSDTGKILGEAVHADTTVTFIGRKLGQVSGEGPSLCGELVFDALDVPAAIYDRVSPAAR